MAQARADERPPTTVYGLRQRLAVVCQQGQQCREVGAVPMAIDPGLGEADIATLENPVENRPAGDLQDCGAVVATLSKFTTRIPWL